MSLGVKCIVTTISCSVHTLGKDWSTQLYTLEQIFGELGSALLVNAMTNELSNPGNDMNSKRNFVSVGVGRLKDGGISGESEEERGCQQLLIRIGHVRSGRKESDRESYQQRASQSVKAITRADKRQEK